MPINNTLQTNVFLVDMGGTAPPCREHSFHFLVTEDLQPLMIFIHFHRMLVKWAFAVDMGGSRKFNITAYSTYISG